MGLIKAKLSFGIKFMRPLQRACWLREAIAQGEDACVNARPKVKKFPVLQNIFPDGGGSGKAMYTEICLRELPAQLYLRGLT